MTPALIPLLVLSLLLMAADGADGDSARLVLGGEHRVATGSDVLIVGDATVTVPATGRVTTPVYIIGGTTRIEGDVGARVTQLAGTLTVGAGARVGELRHIGGATVVSPDARIARRTSPVAPDDTSGGAGPVPVMVGVTVLALAAALIARTHGRNLDVIADAAAGHPVVAVTVGLLMTLTALSLFVFMAFTLVLIPVSVLGLGAGLLVVALGVAAWGRLVGRRLPIGHPAAATGVGAAVVMAVLSLAGRIPVVGDLVVAIAVLGGVGAVLITYLGYSRFRPAVLPD